MARKKSFKDSEWELCHFASEVGVPASQQRWPIANSDQDKMDEYDRLELSRFEGEGGGVNFPVRRHLRLVK